MPEPLPPRYAPATPLPPYAYVPGHGLPHPVNDPAGHSFAGQAEEAVRPAGAARPESPPERDRWLHAIDLFNNGFYWEAHEAWEGVWNALGRTTPAARFVQGLIHLAAAAVKIREGKPDGVRRHARRARELLATPVIEGSAARQQLAAIEVPGLVPESLTDVLAELEAHRQACWHTSRTPAVRVLATNLLRADDGSVRAG